MIYFVPGVYLPNTAATNRILAYLKFLSEERIETKVLFFTPNNSGTVMSPLLGIRVHNVWKNYLFKKGLLKYLSLLRGLLVFRFKLKKGDIVYCYENVQFWKLFLKKNVRVYAEYTENPDVIGLGGKFLHTSKKRFKSLCRNLSGLFVISTALKDYFINLGVDENRIHIINIIVDGDRFKGLTREQGREPYIAYCGSANNNKDGVDQLIKSFTHLNKKHSEIKLFIVGANPKKNQECSNVQLAKDLGIDSKVIFTGVVTAEKMPQLLINALILALDRPDNIQAKYGFPTKLGEYLLTGNPTVLTAVGDLPLFLEDKVSTIFARPDDPIDFSSKLCWCIENYDAALEIGKRGRDVACKNFNYKNETEKMIRVMLNDNL